MGRRARSAIEVVWVAPPACDPGGCDDSRLTILVSNRSKGSSIELAAPQSPSALSGIASRC